jgi:spore maturation protein CgeB
MGTLHIAFFGSSILSAYWNGAATYYRGVIKYLHARGHHVTFYEPDAFERQTHRDLEPPSWCDVVVYSGEDERDVWRVLELSRGADVLVKASGVGVWDALLESAIPQAKRPGAVAVYWDVDAPATLARMRDDPDDPLRRILPRYDAAITYGGGQPVVRGYLEAGARVCVPVYNALDPETHFPVAPQARFGCDFALLANRLPDREARIEEFFFRPARALPEKSFLLGGNGWGDKPLPPNVKALGHVYTADHNAWNASAAAVLNVARDSMAAVGWSPATRVFEAAGAAACVISDAWRGLEDFLAPDREVLVARDGEEVAALLRALTPEKARTIGVAARARVLSSHTYAVRAKQVEGLLEELRRNAARGRNEGVPT